MLVKSFVLRRESFDAIVNQCVRGTIAVVRPEKALIHLFQSVIYRMIEEKQSAEYELADIKAYLNDVSDNAVYQQKKTEFIEYVEDYLRKATSYNVPVAAVEDYIIAQCANLCTQAVAISANFELIDGRDLVVCHQKENAPVFDWAATSMEIKERCEGKSHFVISGGYARTPNGEVIGIGKGGANMMAALVAAPFIPKEFFECSLEEFWKKLPSLDAEFERERKELEKEHKCWRFVATMDEGKYSVALKSFDEHHSFYNLEGANSIVLLTTERYHKHPMLIQGYGAGASVTAAGVFADIISIANVTN